MDLYLNFHYIFLVPRAPLHQEAISVMTIDRTTGIRTERPAVGDTAGISNGNGSIESRMCCVC